MPLTRAEGPIASTGWALEFPMLSLQGAQLRCFVATRVLKEIGRQGSPIDPWSVFRDRRDLIESVASQKFDCGAVEHGIVVVRSEDMRKAGY